MFPSPVFYSLKDLCQLFWATPGSIDIFLSLQRNSYTVANSLKLTSFFIISFFGYRSRHFGKSCTFGCPYQNCQFTTKGFRHFREHLAKHDGGERYIGESCLVLVLLTLLFLKAQRNPIPGRMKSWYFIWWTTNAVSSYQPLFIKCFRRRIQRSKRYTEKKVKGSKGDHLYKWSNNKRTPYSPKDSLHRPGVHRSWGLYETTSTNKTPSSS